MMVQLSKKVNVRQVASCKITFETWVSSLKQIFNIRWPQAQTINTYLNPQQKDTVTSIKEFRVKI